MQNGIINEIETQDVEIVYKDGNMAYSPIKWGIMRIGDMVIDENSSIYVLIYVYTFR